MSDLTYRGPGVTEPCPNVTQHGQSPVDAGGTFSQYGMTLEPWGASGAGTLVNVTGYPIGTDATQHYTPGYQFVGPPMRAQTLNGTWTAQLRCLLNALPTIASIYVGANLYRWIASSDTAAGIGTGNVETVYTQAAVKEYSMSFGSASVTFSEGDRLVVEHYFHVDDDPTDPFGGGIVTISFRYGSTTNNSRLTTPGTLVPHLPRGDRLPLMGAGYSYL